MPNLPQGPSGSLELGEEVREEALRLAARGIRVFPVHSYRLVAEPGPDGEPRTVPRCTCSRPACNNPAKHPVGHLVPHGHNDASTDPARVSSWFQTPANAAPGWVPWNLAIATGSGLVVIDAEAKQTRTDLPTGVEVLDDWETWTRGTSLPANPRVHRTGGGGLHLWLRVDDGLRVKSGNRVLPAVDVKADGGYVLVPPSTHVSGGFYTVLKDVEPPACAPELVAWLLTVKGGRYVTRRSGAGAPVVPDDYDFRRIVQGDGCPSGHRDYFVNDLCFRLRRAGAAIEDAAEALRREWLRMDNPPGDEFTWDACVYKLRRVWDEVQPEDVTDVPAWRPPTGLIGTAAPGLQSGAAAGMSHEDPAVSLDQPIVSGRTAAELLDRPELTFKRSDTGNGERFAQRMRDVVRFCVGEDRWYLWDGSRWRRDELNRVLVLTKEIVKDLYVEAANLQAAERDRHEQWAQTSQSAGRREAMLRIASAEPGIAIRPDDLDADPWLLGVRNGVVDLRTQTLRASDPADLLTRRAEVDFDPAAECPLWLRHVEFVTNGDAALAAWLRRAVGYTLTGLTSEQQLFFLWGTGANGKSTLLDVLLMMLGSYGIVGDENLLTSTSGHPTQLADLRGARLIVCDETDREKKLAEQRIKMMTGKQIKARFMRQDFFTYTPRFKLWISGNHKPEIRGGDDGIWRRLKLVPFTAKLNDDTKILGYEEILRQELSGILNWALVGLADWVKLGQLGGVKAIDEATGEYRDEEDPIGQWFEECCVLEPDAVTPTAELFGSWSWWAIRYGFDPGNKTTFGRDLTQKRGLVGGHAPGGKVRIRIGVRLLNTTQVVL